MKTERSFRSQARHPKVHERFTNLPETHRRVLGYYYEEQRRMSTESSSKKAVSQNEDLIELGRGILWHIHDRTPLPQIDEATLQGFVLRFGKSVE